MTREGVIRSRKLNFLVLGIICLILPLLGLVVAGHSLSPILQFPPETRQVELSTAFQYRIFRIIGCGHSARRDLGIRGRQTGKCRLSRLSNPDCEKPIPLVGVRGPALAVGRLVAGVESIRVVPALAGIHVYVPLAGLHRYRERLYQAAVRKVSIAGRLRALSSALSGKCGLLVDLRVLQPPRAQLGLYGS